VHWRLHRNKYVFEYWCGGGGDSDLVAYIITIVLWC
jgi:hypothetical protein